MWRNHWHLTCQVLLKEVWGEKVKHLLCKAVECELFLCLLHQEMQCQLHTYPCNDPWANSHSGRIYTSCIILWSCLAAVEWSSTSLDGANSNDAKPAMFQRFVAVQARRPVATCLVTGASVMSIGDSAVQLCGSGTLDLERNVVVSAYNAGLGSKWVQGFLRSKNLSQIFANLDSHRIFVLWDSFRERSEMVGDHS